MNRPSQSTSLWWERVAQSWCPLGRESTTRGRKSWSRHRWPQTTSTTTDSGRRQGCSNWSPSHLKHHPTSCTVYGFDFCFCKKMVWEYGESKLRCVSGTLGHHSHYCASTNRPTARLRLRTWRLCRAARRRVTAITADTLCRLVRRLSPELSERDRTRRSLACCSDSESSPYPTSDCRSPPFIPPRHVGQPRACVFVLEGCAFIGKTVLSFWSSWRFQAEPSGSLPRQVSCSTCSGSPPEPPLDSALSPSLSRAVLTRNSS